MKIKCLKTKVEGNDFIINGDITNYIQVGQILYVFGIRIKNNNIYAYVFNKLHLFEVPISLFEIIDNTLPSRIKMKVSDEDGITFWPELFYQIDFFENFSEHEVKERNQFHQLYDKIC